MISFMIDLISANSYIRGVRADADCVSRFSNTKRGHFEIQEQLIQAPADAVSDGP